jgi:hypothetical protein
MKRSAKQRRQPRGSYGRLNPAMGLHEKIWMFCAGGDAYCGDALRFSRSRSRRSARSAAPAATSYSPDQVGPLITLRQLSDYHGQDLVSATVAVVRRLRPVHVSIIGGEPLVRYRERCELLPLLDRMGVEVQLVTSAVRPIPEEPLAR